MALLLFQQACNSPQKARSSTFTDLVTEKEGIFRGVELGWPLEEVKKVETAAALVHDDEFGLVYKLELEGGRYARIEYFTDPERDNQELISIICNVHLNDQVEAGDLYREMEEHLSNMHGVADGGFGDRKWVSSRAGRARIETRLKMLPGKEGISLNFFIPSEFREK